MPQEYFKQVILKDGQEVVLRLLQASDREKLRAFFGRIPEKERWYHREDISDPEVVRRLVETIDLDRVWPVVAEVDDRLVAQANLLKSNFGCFKHLGRLEILVDPEFRGRRLGTWMLLELINRAVAFGLERLEARFVVGPEDAAVKGVRHLDFFEAATLPRYAKSPEGQYHDLKIMLKRLHPGWDDF